MKAKKKLRSNRVASDELLGVRLTRYEQLPKKAKVNKGTAWWYAERKGISVYIAEANGAVQYIVEIPFKKLKEYVQRLTPNAANHSPSFFQPFKQIVRLEELEKSRVEFELPDEKIMSELEDIIETGLLPDGDHIDIPTSLYLEDLYARLKANKEVIK